MRYAIVIENAGGNYSAYVPDLPGCIATGETLAGTEQAVTAFYLTTCNFGRFGAALGLPVPGVAGGLSVGSGSASPSGKIMPCPVSRA
jgi:hypothetical protein